MTVSRGWVLAAAAMLAACNADRPAPLSATPDDRIDNLILVAPERGAGNLARWFGALRIEGRCLHLMVNEARYTPVFPVDAQSITIGESEIAVAGRSIPFGTVLDLSGGKRLRTPGQTGACEEDLFLVSTIRLAEDEQ